MSQTIVKSSPSQVEPFSIKIKCGNCNKNKSRELYSATSLSKYQESQRKRARNPNTPLKTIFCLACNNINRDELQCSHCDRVMALERFNKAQRRKGDAAMCLDCSQERIDREADHAKEVQEIIIISELEKNDHGSYAHSSKLGSQLSGSRSTNDRYETDTNPGSQYYVQGNDAVSLAGTSDSGTSSSGTRPTTGTSWDAFPGTRHQPSGSRGNSNAGFVKQGAVPKNPVEKAMQTRERQLRQAREQEEVVRDDSDDDGDNDDGDPY